MDRFHVIDDAAVILRSKGVYRQAKLYWRAERLYAGYGNGFIMLYQHGRTGVPNISWDELDTGLAGRPGADELGRMTLPTPTKQIEAPK